MSTQRGKEPPQVPVVGKPLPRADCARIDPDKLVRYALDPRHPVGRHKATVFRLALGIVSEDWRYLRDRILAQLPHQPVTRVREPTQGAFTSEVLVPIQGLGAQSGRELLAVTAWQMVEGRPELVTIRVASKDRQRTAGSG